MNIDVHWREIDGDRDEAWSWSPALYAYAHPSVDELLYVGKADGVSTTIRTRYSAPDKMSFWRDLESQRRIRSHVVLAGDIVFPGRLTRELVADIESLLIKRIKPWGNIQATLSRSSRPGMTVHCHGEAWFHQRRFRDVG